MLNDHSVIGQKRERLPQCSQRHIGQARQGRAVSTAAPGYPDASDVRDQKLGDRFGVEASGDIAFPLRITNAGGDGSAEACCQQRIDLLEVGTGGAELIDRADTETWLIGRLNDAPQHRVYPVDSSRAPSKDVEMRSAFAHPIATCRRAIELPLIAKGGVEALSSDPHRIDEHLGGGPLEPMLTEHGDSIIERGVRIEFPWSRHKPHLAIQERTFKILIMQRPSR